MKQITEHGRTNQALGMNTWIDNGHPKTHKKSEEQVDTLVIGGGQAGLATGFHLARHHQRFVILEAGWRIGDTWRGRWDSLRLLAPARYSRLPGMKFPAPSFSFPTKDEMASYLETYAHDMKLPVRRGIRVHRVSQSDDGFLVETDKQNFRASHVVVASGAYQSPKIPPFASKLDLNILQIHSSEYHNPAQFQEGDVLVVGASNSGAEIAHEAARDHHTWLSGRDTGSLPFDTHGRAGRLLIPIMWFAFNHVLTTRTPLGRKVRPLVQFRGAPLERIRPSDLAEAGVERVYERTSGIKDGKPVLEGGRVLDVANIVWCTGFRPDFSWIELPVTDADGWPIHQRGVVPEAPGLYFVGLPFLYAAASQLIGGVGRDADYIARHIAARTRTHAR